MKGTTMIQFLKSLQNIYTNTTTLDNQLYALCDIMNKTMTNGYVIRHEPKGSNLNMFTKKVSLVKMESFSIADPDHKRMTHILTDGFVSQKDLLARMECYMRGWYDTTQTLTIGENTAKSYTEQWKAQYYLLIK